MTTTVKMSDWQIYDKKSPLQTGDAEGHGNQQFGYGWNLYTRNVNSITLVFLIEYYF